MASYDHCSWQSSFAPEQGKVCLVERDDENGELIRSRGAPDHRDRGEERRRKIQALFNERRYRGLHARTPAQVTVRFQSGDDGKASLEPDGAASAVVSPITTQPSTKSLAPISLPPSNPFPSFLSFPPTRVTQPSSRAASGIDGRKRSRVTFPTQREG